MIGSDETSMNGVLGNGAAANFFHAHRWVLEGRADLPVESVGGVLALLEQGEACKRKAVRPAVPAPSNSAAPSNSSW